MPALTLVAIICHFRFVIYNFRRAQEPQLAMDGLLNIVSSAASLSTSHFANILNGFDEHQAFNQRVRYIFCVIRWQKMLSVSILTGTD